ncbi:MAG TPA: alpha/beta hydrolase [Solirubrobacteraceae bacterium]|nr:alpha/beta hydrolase [Solirubrobacteraceae bacterium]
MSTSTTITRPIRSARATLRGLDSAWLQAPSDGTPTLYVHGVPDEGSMWTPFLERTGGIAPDLPGFGESGKPRDFPYGIEAIADHLEALLDHLQIDRVKLVAHDWGGAALAFAQRRPERIERLVLIDAGPLLPDYHWHRLARIWRTPVAGELFMLLATKPALRVLSREAAVAPGPMPEEWLERVWFHFDRGTRRAILRLYRSAPEQDLARAGARLSELTCPALVVWGERDPYVPVRFADAYGAVLPDATVERVPDASHWCWIDRPDLVERIAGWLGDEPITHP